MNMNINVSHLFQKRMFFIRGFIFLIVDTIKVEWTRRLVIPPRYHFADDSWPLFITLAVAELLHLCYVRHRNPSYLRKKQKYKKTKNKSIFPQSLLKPRHLSIKLKYPEGSSSSSCQCCQNQTLCLVLFGSSCSSFFFFFFFFFIFFGSVFICCVIDNYGTVDGIRWQR